MPGLGRPAWGRLMLCGALLAGCADEPAPGVDADVPAALTVTSPAFAEGRAVPSRFTCDGASESPPLAWAGETREPGAWALVVDDPDAPGGTFVHWVVLDIPAATGAVGPGEVPRGAVQAVNSAGDASYSGPCPPEGTHRYRFTVYALAAPTGLEDGVGLEEATAAIESEASARGTLVGTYRRGSS